MFTKFSFVKHYLTKFKWPSLGQWQKHSGRALTPLSSKVTGLITTNACAGREKMVKKCTSLFHLRISTSVIVIMVLYSASSGSTVVELLPQHTKVKSLSHVTADTRREKMVKNDNHVQRKHSGRPLASPSQSQGFKSHQCWHQEEENGKEMLITFSLMRQQ